MGWLFFIIYINMRKPKHFKTVDLNIKTYYSIELLNGNNIVYDLNMRNPICWGSLVITDGFLSTLPEDYRVIYYKVSGVKGLEKTNRKRPVFNKDLEIKDLKGRDIETAWTSLDLKERIFYYVRLDNGKTVLFDSEMGQPLFINTALKGYGNRQMLDVIVSKLNPDSTIYYFDQLNGELKLKAAYTPKKDVKNISDRKEQSKKQEDKKKNKKLK